MIPKLKEEFKGSGSVRGFHFKQLIRDKNKAIYEVNTGDTIHYEVFKIQIRKNWYKTIGERYPSDFYFGKSAWCFSNKEQALRKYSVI